MLFGLFNAALNLLCLLQDYLNGILALCAVGYAGLIDSGKRKNSKILALRGRPSYVLMLLWAAILAMTTVGQVLAAIPTYQAAGTFRGGTGSVTPTWPNSHAVGDIALLFVESVGGEAVTLSTPAGFTQVPNSPQFSGTGTGAGSTRLTVFWARATSNNMPDPVVADPGNHVAAQIIIYRGVIDTGNPWDVTAGGSKATASTSLSVTGVTTTVPDTLIVQAASKDTDSSAAGFSAQANGNLTNIVERVDTGTNRGVGGGFAVWDGGKAALGATGTTTVTVTNSVNAFMTIALKPNITNLATGADPAAVIIAPGSPAQDVNAFTLQTNGGTETISSVTVNLSTNSGIGLLSITDNAGVVLGSTASPVTGSNTITVSGMSATATLAAFKVRITPKSHALMPVPPGGTYLVTAPVTAWAGGSTHTGSDTNVNALTMDNLSPASATAVSGGSGDAKTTLNWTTSNATDFNPVAGSVVYRWAAGTAGTEVPAEGTSPAIGVVNGTATVACVVSAAASTALSRVDGSGGSADCTTTALTNDQAYSYKVFQKDASGNYDIGVVVGSFTPVSPLPPATNFNCLESIITPYNAESARLYTKLAGNSFSFDVVALNASGAVATNYASSSARNVTVELVDGSGATSCNLRSPISPGVSQTLAFTSGNAGRKSTAAMTVNVAYPDVLCRVTDANQSPSIVGCSSDHFAVRPSSFTVSSNMNADASGSSVSATPKLKVGVNFSLSATSNVLGYAGVPKLDNTKVVAHAGAVQAGTLSGSFNGANPVTGIATNSSFAYSEVGYFSLGANGVYDDTFAAVDSGSGDCTADFSNTLSGGKYGCKFGNTSASSYFGRFIPDHLLTQVLSHGGFASSCTGFSYNGQDIYYGAGNHPMLNVWAYNTSTVTKNYKGTFARLLANQFSLTAPTADALKKGVDNSTYVKLTAAMDTPSLTDNGNGNLTLVLGNDKFTYQREANAMIVPFNNAVAITVASVTDSDGVTATSLPMVLQPAGENIRYGRVNLMNAYGSELVDLPMPMLTEQYNGSSFVTNTDDKCSVATLSLSDPIATDSLGVGDSCIWDNAGVSGGNKCSGTAPTGESFVSAASLMSGSFNLYLKAANKIGSLNVTAAVASWLQFNWQGAGMTNPVATASFGIYKGSSKQIYRREMY